MAQKPRKLIIHAGMHKTGSTAIQHWLHTNKLPGAHYISWRNANHSDLFVLLFEDDPQEYFAYARDGYTQAQAMHERAEERGRIRREIETSDEEVFVFSAERVSAAPEPAVAAMHAFFSEVFTDIQVYAYVRKPSGFMTSMFQQHLKTGRAKFGFAELWPGYRRRLKRFFEIFGPENVHLRSYDRLVEEGHEIVGDFARWTGLATRAPDDIVRNKSMSATGTALLYFYRIHVEPELTEAERAQGNRHVVRALQGMPGAAFHIDLDYGEAQRQKVAQDLKWISKQMGFDLDDLGVARAGAVPFRTEDDIIAYAMAKSHELMPRKRLAPLDPDAPESLEETRARFRAFLAAPWRLRARIARRIRGLYGRLARTST